MLMQIISNDCASYDIQPFMVISFNVTTVLTLQLCYRIAAVPITTKWTSEAEHNKWKGFGTRHA